MDRLIAAACDAYHCFSRAASACLPAAHAITASTMATAILFATARVASRSA